MYFNSWWFLDGVLNVKRILLLLLLHALGIAVRVTAAIVHENKSFRTEFILYYEFENIFYSGGFDSIFV